MSLPVQITLPLWIKSILATLCLSTLWACNPQAPLKQVIVASDTTMAASTASTPVVAMASSPLTDSTRTLSPTQEQLASKVYEALKSRQYQQFSDNIDATFAAEIAKNPKLLDDIAFNIPTEEPVKPPKIYAIEEGQFPGYGNILMATYDYPYAQKNVLYVIAFDAAQDSNKIKSLAAYTTAGHGDYAHIADSQNTPASTTQ